MIPLPPATRSRASAPVCNTCLSTFPLLLPLKDASRPQENKEHLLPIDDKISHTLPSVYLKTMSDKQVCGRESDMSYRYILNRQGAPIKTVGHNKFGFDSTVDVDVLRSLYLVRSASSSSDAIADSRKSPSYIKDSSRGTAPLSDYGTESTYNKDNNSIQYTTVAKFPPVRLLPNAERKRILGECVGVELHGGSDAQSYGWCRVRWLSLGRPLDAARARGHSVGQFLHRKPYDRA